MPATPSPSLRRGRTLVRLLLLSLCLFLAAPAQLATAATDPTVGPTIDNNVLPLTVVLTSVTPDAVGPDAPVAVTATITNTGSDEITDLQIRLQRDKRQATRSAMGETDAEAPDYAAKVGTWDPVEGTLAPGASMTVSITRPAAKLTMVDTGVYPLLLNVNGIVDGHQTRVGQSATYIPYFEAAPTTAVSVAWLWPLIERPHRGVDERYFLDDDLATSVRAGGRLDSMLRLAEKYGESAQMTLLVDPNLVAELEAMSDGYQVSAAASTGAAPSSPANTVDGKGTQDAADFLTRLRVLAQTVPVAATAYADVDTVALTRAGLGSEVAEARTYGRQLVDTALGIDSVTDLDWPASGLLTDAARDADAAAGVDTLVLSGTSFGLPDQLTSADGVTEDPLTTLPGSDATALAVDPSLTRIIAEGPSYAGGPVSARQRFTSELAAVLGEAPNRARSVLVVPPRYWQPPTALAESLLGAPGLVPWITPTSLDQQKAGTPADRGALVYPKEQSVEELSAGGLASLQQARGSMANLRSAMSAKDASALLNPYSRAVWRAASSSSRATPALLPERAGQILASLATLRGLVTIIPPSDTYTLSSSSAPLIFTVQNDLDVAINVRVVVGARGTPGLQAVDANVHQIQPKSRATITVPATVERSGSFQIIAGIVTPDNTSLGSSVELTVRSTAYGAVALIVTGAAFALLLALFARRWVRRIKARRAAAEAAAAPAEPGPADLEDTVTLHRVP